jgi:hypothetical protein
MASMRLLATVVFAAVALSGFSQDASSKADILIVTGAEGASSEARAAALSLGKKVLGYSVRAVELDDKTLMMPVVLSERISALAAETSARAVIVHGADASFAFKSLQAASPGILLISVRPEGPALEAEASSALVIDLDWTGRAVFLARTAARYGIKEILFSPDARERGSEDRRNLKNVLSSAATEAFLSFTEFPAKVDKAAFLDERLKVTGGKLLLWIGEGQDSPGLLARLLAGGGYFLEQPVPTIREDYPALFRVEKAPKGDEFTSLVKAAEKSAIEMGAAGKFGVWPYPADRVLMRAAAAIASESLEKRNLLSDAAFIRAKMAAETGGGKFELISRIDPETGVRARNHYLFREDLYVLGKGLLPAKGIEIPEKYYMKMKAN